MRNHPASRFAIACLAAVCLAGCDGSAQPVRKPNVLLIVADDFGYNDLAINNGNTAIRTPALDQLAREGVRFTQHYADAVCSPARAALLTGMNPARLGYSPNGRGISPQFVTLAEVLQGAGYRTMHIGKWHIGDTLREAWPDRQGFEHWFGFLNQWYLAGTRRGGQLVADQPRYTDPWLMRDGDAGARYTGHVDDLLTDEAVQQIQALRDTGAPWFINLWLYAPHAPVTPAPAYAAKYPVSAAGRYRALLSQLDDNVARVLAALEHSGQGKSTLVVFVSDNGGTAQQQADSNAPFYGVKATYWEGGVRTPLLIRWPDAKQAGSLRDDVAAIYDIYPTILASLDIAPPPGLDGQDLQAAGRQPRDLFWEVYSAGHYGYSVLRDGAWRLYRKWPYKPWEVPAVLVDTAPSTVEPTDFGATRPELVAALEDARRAWQRDVHRIPVRLEHNADGTTTASGADFLRTPGFGGFSFAIGVRESYSGVIATQQDIWSMEVSADGALRADFQGHQVQGALGPGACHSAIVSAWFNRRTSNWKEDLDLIDIRLYVDGTVVDSHSQPGVLDDRNVAAPTRIGNPSAPALNRLLGEPLLLSAPVEASDAWQPAAVHRSLCPEPGV